jgi:hypothetical protein
MFQAKVVGEKTGISYLKNFFPENHAVCKTMWENIVEPGRSQMRVWRMRLACWIPKATNALSEYVMLNALPLQQFLHERASMLRYTYTA